MEQSDYKFWNHLSFQQMPSSYFPWTSLKVPIQTKIWSKCVNYEIEKEVPELIPVIDGSNQEWPGLGVEALLTLSWGKSHKKCILSCWHFLPSCLSSSSLILQLLKSPPTFWNIPFCSLLFMVPWACQLGNKLLLGWNIDYLFLLSLFMCVCFCSFVHSFSGHLLRASYKQALS